MFQSQSGASRRGVSFAVEQQKALKPHWRRRGVVLMLALCALSPPHVQAAYICKGKVTQLTTEPGGGVNLSLVGDGVALNWQVVCSTNGVHEGIDAASCKAILATLMAAQASDRAVWFWFDYSYTGPPKCSDADHPPWTSLRSSGWYWGPTAARE